MILDCGHPDNGDLCTVHERDCTYHGHGVCTCPNVCPACCPECRGTGIVPATGRGTDGYERCSPISPIKDEWFIG